MFPRVNSVKNKQSCDQLNTSLSLQFPILLSHAENRVTTLIHYKQPIKFRKKKHILRDINMVKCKMGISFDERTLGCVDKYH